MNWKTQISAITLLVSPVSSNAATANSPLSYLIGGIIALLIMGYLVYTLLRPEKF